MKIVVKQVDFLVSLSSTETIIKYLVYLMGCDNRAIMCDIAYGKLAKDKIVDKFLGEFDEKDTLNMDLIIEEISLNEFIKSTDMITHELN